MVKQVKNKAADKWRRANLERGEGCDSHKRRTQTWMQPTQEGMEEVRRGVGSKDIRKEEWWNDQWDVQPITCGKEKTFRMVWREAELEDVFPAGQLRRGKVDYLE